MKIEWKNKTWKTDGTLRHAYVVDGEIERRLCGAENEKTSKTVTISPFLHGKKCKKCEKFLAIIESKRNVVVVDLSKSRDFVK